MSLFGDMQLNDNRYENSLVVFQNELCEEAVWQKPL